VDRNVVLALVLSMAVFTTWLMWQESHREALEEASPEIAVTGEPTPGEVGAREAEPSMPAPDRAPTPEPARAEASPAATAPRVALPEREERRLRFARDLYAVELTSRGAGILSWTLSDYMERTETGEQPIELITADAEDLPVLGMPFTELGFGDLSRADYAVDSQSEDAVSFVWEYEGVRIRKTYGFDSKPYRFRLTVGLSNGTDHVLSPRFPIDWPAAMRQGNDFRELALAALHAGDVESERLPGVGSPGLFDRLFGGGRGPHEPTALRGDVEWAGVNTRYFVGVLAPDLARKAEVVFEPIQRGERAKASIGFEAVELPPGRSVEREYRGYIGPKEPEQLEAFGSDLRKSINLGYRWVAPLTRFFGWLLHASHAVIPNYGVAIIIITVLVRLLASPIMTRQMRSMERMRELQPKLKEIQEKHGDDRQKQSEEMMKLYRQSGVNPLSGCLPMLLQLPVFIGLFYALQASIDLRHAHFVGWIDDLSAPEQLFVIPGLGVPFRVLPLIMGASMVLQQRFTPTTVDPSQARMMLVVMPVMMTVIFYQFPSGLVLYWMVSNFLGIAHQLWIRRRMHAGA
jgi:YidC/Oxa1 family membrane protein insertase